MRQLNMTVTVMKEPVTEPRYSIGELAELGRVSRRTVHFYVQQGLIDPPEGRGRGSYYAAPHLEQQHLVLAVQPYGLTPGRPQSSECVRTDRYASTVSNNE